MSLKQSTFFTLVTKSGSSSSGTCTVYLETTHGLDFKTPKFPHHVIYSRYRLEEENPYILKKLHVIFGMSSATFVEDSSFK